MLRVRRLICLTTACAGVISQLTAQPAVAAPHPSNLTRTRMELHRLTADVRLPAGSVRHSPVRRLRSPGESSPRSRSLQRRTQFYRVPISFSSVPKWIRRHPPGGGLSFAGVGSSGSISSTPSERFIEYSDRDTAAFLQPTLEYSVVAAHRGFTLWRVDEAALWLDPHPRIRRPGPLPLRVTRSTGCPASDRGSSDVRNPGSGLYRHLVPAAPPTRVLVCTYNGVNGADPFGLTSARHAGPRRARALSHAARRISLAHLDGVVRHCPLDTDAVTVVDFHYARRPDVDLWYSRAGCTYLANGHTVSGDAPGRTPFFRLLRRLS